MEEQTPIFLSGKVAFDLRKVEAIAHYESDTYYSVYTATQVYTVAFETPTEAKHAYKKVVAWWQKVV